MGKIYIRWMNLYAGRDIPLKKVLQFELVRKDEAACEPVQAYRSGIAKSGMVGVIIRNEAIIKEFRSDCWSRYGERSRGEDPTRLYRGSLNSKGRYGEAFAKMQNAVIGIVVFGGFAELRQDKRNTVVKFAKANNLPVFRLTNKGGLVKEALE